VNKDKAVGWLTEHGCFIAMYKGNDFVIVGMDGTDPTSDPLFGEAISALGNSARWGFSDSYTTCSGCGDVICTRPSSLVAEDFWLDLDNGEIFCNECAEANAPAYFTWLADQAMKGHAVNCVLRPPKYGFTFAIADLEYGLHPGQNDDPRKLITWAHEHHLDIVFTALFDPFTTLYDVWLRPQPIDIEEIRKELLADKSSSGYDRLRPRFRDWL